MAAPPPRRLTRTQLILIATALFFFCGVCSLALGNRASRPVASPAPTQAAQATTIPTDVPAPTTVPTVPAALTTVAEPTVTTTDGFPSRALGLSRAAFEVQFGQPSQDLGMIVNYGGGISVIYVDGVVAQVEQGIEPPVSLAEARALAPQLLPLDAKAGESYTAPSGSPVDRFSSAALADRFEPFSFVGGEPGDLIVIYRTDDRGVFGLVVGLGNNP